MTRTSLSRYSLKWSFNREGLLYIRSFISQGQLLCVRPVGTDFRNNMISKLIQRR